MRTTPEDELTVDESVWPILLLTFHGFAGPNSIQKLMQAYERALTRASRYVSIIDGTSIEKFPAAAERETLTDWMKSEQNVAREKMWSLGAAVVVPSGPLRALLAAFNLVRRPITPQHWVATLDEGWAWAEAQLTTAGIALTPQIQALRADLHAKRAAARKRH